MIRLIIKNFPFLLPILILLSSSCDIIDEAFGRGRDNENGNSNIREVEVKYFIDNANYDDGTSGEHQGEFTSNAGTSSYENNEYDTKFDNPPVLGKRIRGDMFITFNGANDNRSLNVFINTEIAWSWNDAYQLYMKEKNYQVSCDYVPYNKSYIDEVDGDNVVEYYLSGNAMSGIRIKYSTAGTWAGDYDLTTFTCGNRAYIKVKVHYE